MWVVRRGRIIFVYEAWRGSIDLSVDKKDLGLISFLLLLLFQA